MGEELERDVGDAEQAPSSRSQHQPLARMQTREPDRARYQQRAGGEYARLQRNQRGQRGPTRVTSRATGYAKHRQPHRGKCESDPLPATEMKAEEQLREHREEHKPAG